MTAALRRGQLLALPVPVPMPMLLPPSGRHRLCRASPCALRACPGACHLAWGHTSCQALNRLSTLRPTL